MSTCEKERKGGGEIREKREKNNSKDGNNKNRKDRKEVSTSHLSTTNSQAFTSR